MHKRTLHSLLIVSFIVAFAASMSFAADQVIVQSKAGLQRCVDQEVTVTANVDAPISAIEVVLDVTGVGCGSLSDVVVEWDLAEGVLTDRYMDLTAYPLIRFAAMSTGPEPENLGAGTGQAIATISFTTGDCCAGSVEIAGGVWPSQPPFGTIQTQFVDAATGGLRQVAVTTGVIGIENDAPSIDDVPGGPFTILHGDLFQVTLNATDPDMANGCETLTYFIQSGPDGMAITGGNKVTWQTDGDDVCEFEGDVIVGVRDKCQAEDLAAAFQICVTNNPPEFTTYPTELVEIAWGMTYNTTLLAVDPDPGPYGPHYNLIDWGYAATPPVVDAATGEFTWVTEYEPEFTGLFDIYVTANDGAPLCDCAPSNADTVHFQIRVVPFQLTIEKVEDAYLGQPVEVSITMLDDQYVNKEIGGFDFLIQYDASAMMFMYASEGQFLIDCEWEYFTYRYGPNGNCGPSACPSGVLRVVAMGETTGGNLAHHPTCWTNEGGASNELVKLHFLLSNDANLECQFAAIRWIWYDCGDNGVSSRDGQYLFISELVYDFAGFDEFGDPIFNLITGLDPTFPTMTGAPEECDDWYMDNPNKHPWRLVHFYNGGIDIICSEDIDAVGDININNIAYEIADAVMFTNYFINGLAAFGTHIEGSIAASDTNKDGITLSVADLVYLIRVIIGDALPYAKQGAVAVDWTQDAGIVSTRGDVGGAALVVEGNVTPQLLVSGMDMGYAFDGAVTRIIVTPDLEASTINSFNGPFLGGIDREIISIEMATPEGQPIAAKNIPVNYDLSQNYPNPFNPTTKFDVAIPKAGDYSLVVYNVQGQVVEVINGSVAGPERLTIEWDASTLASGVYLYKFTSGDFTAVKKAVLLK